MRPEPGRDPARVPDRAQLGELGVVVEAVPGLRLEGGRAVGAHPARMPLDHRRQPSHAGGARRLDGRQDAAARRMQLLVARPGRAQRELLDPVAREAGVRVAVDEPGDRAAAAPVDLFDVVLEQRQVAHAPDGLDLPFATQDERAVSAGC